MIRCVTICADNVMRSKGRREAGTAVVTIGMLVAINTLCEAIGIAPRRFQLFTQAFTRSSFRNYFVAISIAVR